MKISNKPPLTAIPPETNMHAAKTTLPNLDGIRALACLMVVISHMPLPIKFRTLGETGVGIFFVLSGFLMSYLYGLIKWDIKTVLRYSIARFSRIAPIYWLVVSLCIFISYYEPDQNFSLRIMGEISIIRHYLFGGNVVIFWSIPLEVQYYIFFIFIWWTISNSRTLPYALPLLGLICSLFLITHNNWPGLALPRQIHFFIAGTLAGMLPRELWTGFKNRTALLLLQAGAILLMALPIWFYPTKPALYAAIELGFGLALAIYLLSIPSKWTTFIFASTPMRIIGRASFSIYLMHILVFYFGMRAMNLSIEKYEPKWIILAIFSVVIPIILSKYIEMPLQKITKKYLEKILLNDSKRFFQRKIYKNS